VNVQKEKNYKIIYRANPKNREKEKRDYKEWVKNNREKRNEIAMNYLNKHRDEINERRTEIKDFYYKPKQKVYF
jgi:hypothetical protein